MADELALGVIVGFENEPQEKLEEVKGLGIPTIQLSYPAHLDSDEGIEKIKAAAKETGIEITTVFCGFEGERYDDIPTVQQTVGFIPESTRAGRVAKTKEIIAFAAKLGVPRVAAHIGFVPEERDNPLHGEVVNIMRELCDEASTRGQVFALETGQETAQGLRNFIEDLKRDNIKVNFDPANMILYGNDNPIDALDVLMPWIDGVHCKDGKWPTEDGKLGEETILGEGDVHMDEWIKKLLSLGFTGTLTIEREISGDEQRKDILKAKELLTRLIAKHRLC